MTDLVLFTLNAIVIYVLADWILKLIEKRRGARLKRVFAIDIEKCPECGGKLRVIACIEEPQLIRQILSHVQQRDGLADCDARGPPGAVIVA